MFLLIKKIIAVLTLVIYLTVTCGTMVIQVSHYISHLLSNSLALHEPHKMENRAESPVHHHIELIDFLMIKGEDLFEKHSAHVLPGVTLFDHQSPVQKKSDELFAHVTAFVFPQKIQTDNQFEQTPISPPPKL